METRDLKQIIKILENSNLEMIEVEQKGLRIKVKKQSNGHVVSTQSPSAVTVNVDGHKTEVVAGTPVKSPLVGTFYSRPNPDEAQFAALGENVEKGQVLCIIEAMKVMNEIKAPRSGKITRITLDDGEMVEFDQVIMSIE